MLRVAGDVVQHCWQFDGGAFLEVTGRCAVLFCQWWNIYKSPLI